MSVRPSAAELQAIYQGLSVTGGAKTLPATGSGDIFTVSGGRVIITSLIGLVTTAIQNQACTLSVGTKPTGGSSATTALCTATSIANLGVGQQVALPNAVSSALIVGGVSGVVAGGSSGGTGVPIQNGGIALVSAGTIQVTTSATNTGAITYTITYIPYDKGAVVLAA